MKRVLKWFGFSVTLVVIFVASLAMAILVFPNLFLNNRTLNWAVKYAPKLGFTLGWREIDLRVGSESLLRKTVFLTAKDFCLGADDKSWNACFKDVQINLTANLSHLVPQITQIGPVALLDGDISYRAAKETKPTEPKNSGSTDQRSPIPSWLTQMDLGRVQLRVNRLRLDLGDSKIDAQMNFLAEGKANASTWDLVFKGVAQSGADRYPVSGNLVAASTGSQLKGPWKVDGGVRGSVGATLPIDVKLRAAQKTPESLNYTIEGKTRVSGYVIDAKIDGGAAFNSLTAKINATAKTPLTALRQVGLTDCTLSLDKKESKVGNGIFAMNCPVNVEANLPAPRKGPQLKFPKGIEVVVAANIDTQFPPDPALNQDGNLSVDLSKIQNGIVAGHGSVGVQFTGKLSNFPEEAKMLTKVDGGLKIARFQDLVKMLQTRPEWAIPEPLNSLSGEVSLDLRGEGKLPWEMKVFPMQVKTRLSSSNQKLDVDAAGEFALATQPRGAQSLLKVRVALSDVTIQLPTLDLQAPPRIVPDARIRDLSVARKTEEDHETASSFQYRFEVKTAKPIKFISNLAQAPIPLSLDVVAESDKPTVVKLDILQFPLELFRRKAEVEHFRVRTGNEGEMNLDGTIRITYTDYVIQILVLGTADSPDIKFLSTPPLSQNQLIAVLLFGKTMDQLEAGQLESVDNARAAAASSAISLASMYLLASTPIESIGYNPGNGQFSAKVRLASGMSLDVGASTQRVERLGLRKRLGTNWSINTYLNDPFRTNNDTTARRAAEAYLEWNKRY